MRKGRARRMKDSNWPGPGKAEPIWPRGQLVRRASCKIQRRQTKQTRSIDAATQLVSQAVHIWQGKCCPPSKRYYRIPASCGAVVGCKY